MRRSIFVIAVAASAPALVAQYGITTRASVSATGFDVGAHSGWASLSDDGRFVAFSSGSSEIVAGDLNGYYDVFVLDRATGVARRVSVGAGGAESNGHSGSPSISADGRLVAFESGASNLALGDFNNNYDVFVVDVATLATRLASVDSVGNPGNGGSGFPRISGDGRYVAFESTAWTFVTNDVNFTWDVYRHDLQTGLTELCSESLAGAAGNSESGGDAHTGPTISYDGRWVAFWSAADDLVPGDTNGFGGFPMCLTCGYDVFVRDMQSATTARISVSASGVQGNNLSIHPAISGDGRFVAFLSGAQNLVPGDTNGWDVFVHDRDADADGIFDEPGAIDVARASVTSSGAQTGGASAGNFGWGGPAISRDGRRVAFMSAASDMTPLAFNGKYNVYVHDLASGLTECPVVTPAGVLEPYHAFQPALDGDGSHVAFTTRAPSLVANDGNNYEDVFVRTLCDEPRSYCTAKVNSLGCTPAIAFDGVPSASLPSSFTVASSNLRNNAVGVLVYSVGGPAATPFQGGFLCLQTPTVRTPLQSTGGSASGLDCSGSLTFDFAAHVQSGADPALVDGVAVYAQFWSRDGGASFGTNLTNALGFTLCGV